MVRFDSVKIELPYQLTGFNTSLINCKEVQEKQENELVKHQYLYTNLDTGFNRVLLNKLNNTVELQLSAKLLKDNYREGININTVDQLCNAISKHKILPDFNTDILYAGGTFRTVDVTSNIEIEGLQKAIKNVVAYGSLNSSYNLQHYNKRTGSSYVATKKVTSYKRRQTGYEKRKELANNKLRKHNPELYRKLTEQFSETSMRVETNITSFKQMRHLFETETNKVQDLINSTENVNYTVFKEIIKKGTQLENVGIVLDSGGTSLPKIIKQVGWNSLFKLFDEDLSKTKNWIKNQFKRGSHNQYYKMADQQYKIYRENILIHQTSLIQEIQEKLKSA